MFFPIGDDNPSETTPWVTYGIIVANGVVFLVANVLGSARFGVLPFRTAWEYGFRPEEPAFTAYFTSLFLHGNLLHILGNMWFLWIVGDNVEDKMGHLPFLGLYLLSGVAACGIYQVLPAGHDVGMLIGASGAIAGILGCYMIFFPRAKIRIFYWVFWILIGTFYLQARWFLGIWIAMNLFEWLLLSSRYVTGVAYAAHVGGFVVGILAAVLLKPRLRRRGRLSPVDRYTGFASGDPEPFPEAPGAPGVRGVAGVGSGAGRGETRPPPRDGSRPGPAGARPRPVGPDFVSPRMATERDAEDFFGLEEAIAENVRKGRIDAALERYDDYLRMSHAKPLPAWAQIRIAAEYYRRPDYERALLAYRRYLADHPNGPDAPEAKFRLGIILSRQRQEYYRAREYLLQAAMEHRDPEIVGYARRELERIREYL